MKKALTLSLATFLALFLSACGGGGGSTSSSSGQASTPGSYAISQGVAQKGPLQIGSSVTVAELDSKLIPNGKIYLTEVSDNLGNFSLGSSIGTSLVLIQAQGFFMDENTGKFTSSSITLRGISDLSVESAPSVNVLTTLQYIRLKNLINSGKTYQDAYKQAQDEVLNAFGVSIDSITNSSSLYRMKINGSSDSDAVLLAISSTLAKAASLRNGSSTAAELSDIINTIASDLSQSGKITTASIQSELVAAQVALDTTLVRSNVQNFYAARGITVDPPRFEDWVSKDGASTLPVRTLINPSDFSISKTNNALPSQGYTSQEFVVSGLPDGVSVAVKASLGSSIIKNSTPIIGLFSSAKNGDKFSLKSTSAAYGGSVNSSLTIGTKTADWVVTTQSPGNVNPTSFALNQLLNAIPNRSYTSNEITIAGLADGEVAFITSDTGATIKLNGSPASGASVIGKNGDVVSLSAVGPAYGSMASYKLTIGSRSATWSVVAQAPSLVTPNNFSFTSLVGEVGQLVTSETIAINGLNSGEVAQAYLTLTGDLPNGASLLINGVVAPALPAIINPGDQLAIRTTLTGSFGSTATIKLTVGTKSSNWTLTTRTPTAKYYKRFGAPGALIQDRYTSGTTYAYYAIPFTSSSAFLLRYFALGIYNGSVDSVSLYSNSVGGNTPGSLLGTASVGSIFNSSSSYTYPSGGYTLSGSGTTYTDASNTIYWISSKIQGKFSSGISLASNTKYWIVVKWNNGFPHDERVDDSTGSTFDFSQAQGSNNGVTWAPISIVGGAVPALFMTD
jgi:hypothetical protein